MREPAPGYRAADGPGLTSGDQVLVADELG
ncbi:hypothetical protein FHS44_001871 [Streptosporangium saharense]|uniref:Uncharacterized protein n=1 Tax=Streptosporangium saharense TaxID=1706840 RepID=A0A7W7QKK7_9ACTN|nr:hypothetical protein [Streptosporangium saharense]